MKNKRAKFSEITLEKLRFLCLDEGSNSDEFFYLSCLTYAFTNVVEFSTANFTTAGNVNLNNVGRVERESLFYADTVSDLSNGKGFSDAAVLLSDYETVKKLNSFSATFFNLVVYNDRITDFELGNFCLQLLVCESLKFIHEWLLLK